MKKILAGLLLLLGVIALVISLVFENPRTLSSASMQRQSLADFSGAQDPEMTRYTISEGRHYSFPRIFKSRNKPERVSWRIIFEESCIYDLGDGDQKDWNKLCGLFFNTLNTLDNTVMVGWRYNLKTGRMELNAYYHVDKSREFTKPLLDVALGEPFQVDILVDYDEKNYSVVLNRLSDGKQVRDSKAFFHDDTNCLEINTYFGGNREAPKDLSILKGYIE